MKKAKLLLVSLTVLLLVPKVAIANDLEAVESQVEAIDQDRSADGADNLLDQLREAQSGPPNSASQTAQGTAQGYTQSGYPDVWGNATDGINDTINLDRVIDPITGRIDGAIGQVEGSINNGINRALNGILSPVDRAIDKTLGSVNSAIDRGIDSIMSPVDKAISGVLDGIDKQINDFLDGIFGKAVEDTVGGVIDEATGGFFGGLLGGDSQIPVEKAYDPLSQIPSIISSATFNTSLARVTSPYADIVPIESGGMGLPDYSNITSVVDALVAGENGSPNQIMQGADRFSISPQGLSSSVVHEIERLGSRAIANGTLSKVAQDKMNEELKGAAETLDTTIEIADNAQEKDVTQDVMKNLSAQLAQDSVIRAGQYRQTMHVRQQQAADAVVQTEIAELLEEQSRARRADLMGNAATMQISTAGLHLPGEAPDEENDAPTTFHNGAF